MVEIWNGNLIFDYATEIIMFRIEVSNGPDGFERSEFDSVQNPFDLI